MADDTDDTAEDERTIELSAISAIFPELSIDPSDAFSAHIDVPVEPQRPLALRFPTPVHGAPPTDLSGATNALDLTHNSKDLGVETRSENGAARTGLMAQETNHISHFPPLKLHFILPSGYPTSKPPLFEIHCSWLPRTKLQELEMEGKVIWENLGKAQVIYAYIDFLREAADDAFGLLSGNRTITDISVDLKVLLMDFDLKAKRAKFEQKTFECGICLGMMHPNIQACRYGLIK